MIKKFLTENDPFNRALITLYLKRKKNYNKILKIAILAKYF